MFLELCSSLTPAVTLGSRSLMQRRFVRRVPRLPPPDVNGLRFRVSRPHPGPPLGPPRPPPPASSSHGPRSSHSGHVVCRPDHQDGRSASTCRSLVFFPWKSRRYTFPWTLGTGRSSRLAANTSPRGVSAGRTGSWVCRAHPSADADVLASLAFRGSPTGRGRMRARFSLTTKARCQDGRAGCNVNIASFLHSPDLSPQCAARSRGQPGTGVAA